MSARIYILPVIRIERGLWQQEFCRDDAARPASGSRPQLIIDNAAPARPRLLPKFNVIDNPQWWQRSTVDPA